MFRKDLEKILKEKYAAQQSDLDHDTLWARVHPEIKKDRKRPFIFWISGLGVLLLGVLIWMLLGTSDIVETTQQTISSQNVELENVEKNEVFNSESSMVVESNNNVSTKKDEVISQTKEFKNASVSSQVKYENNTYDSSSKTKVSTPSETSFKRVSTSSLYSINKSSDLKLDESKSKQESFSPSSFNSEIVKKAILNIEPLYVLNSLLDIPSRELELQLIPFVTTNDNIVFQHRYSMDFMAGYGLVSGVLESANINLLSKRKSTEESLDVISGDVLFNYHMSPHWTIRSGVDYQLITDKTTHSFIRSELVPVDSILLETNEDENGVVSEVFGLGEELQVTNSIKTRYNYYQRFGIPVELVFNNAIGSLQYEIGGGIRLSKLFSAKGFIQELENTEYDLSKDIDNQFGRSINTEILLDAGVIYTMSPRLGWRTALQYKYGLNGINSDLNPISQKYNLIKITTGLRYQF